jgi:hypothetical protein
MKTYALKNNQLTLVSTDVSKEYVDRIKVEVSGAVTSNGAMPIIGDTIKLKTVGTLAMDGQQIKDNRRDNPTPIEVMTNFARSVRWELKERAAIGLANWPDAGTEFCTVQTIANWPDKSAGGPIQIAYVRRVSDNNVMTRSRSCTDDQNWSSWKNFSSAT